MAKIYTIKKNGETAYPRTISDAVAVAGSTLTDALNNIKVTIEAVDVKEWVGTQAEFDKLTTFDEKTTYYIYD